VLKHHVPGECAHVMGVMELTMGDSSISWCLAKFVGLFRSSGPSQSTTYLSRSDALAVPVDVFSFDGNSLLFLLSLHPSHHNAGLGLGGPWLTAEL